MLDITWVSYVADLEIVLFTRPNLAKAILLSVS